jgi:hypothetical protein
MIPNASSLTLQQGTKEKNAEATPAKKRKSAT